MRRSQQGPRLPEPIDFDPESERGLAAAAADMRLPRETVVEFIVKDWLVGHGYVAAVVLDEESETAGNA